MSLRQSHAAGVCQAPHPCSALPSASVSPPGNEGGETHHGALPVAARGGCSSLHRINELCGGLALSWSETEKLLLEKGEPRAIAQLNTALLSLGRREAFCSDPGKMPRG